MTTNTAPESALDGLLTCGECGEPMPLDESPEPVYACRAGPGNGWSHCRTPRMRAGPAEDLLIGAVLQAVLTERNIATVVAAATEPQPGDDTSEYRITGEEIQELKTRPDLFIQAVGGTEKTRGFLATFIAEIQVHSGKGVIQYSIPLPADSPLAGMSQQEVAISEEALA